jgi:hypothetical protein
MSVAHFQARIGIALIGVFIVGLMVLNARSPEHVEMNEQDLGNIVLGEVTDFKKGFGAFLELVPDNGGDQPVPFDGLAPQRYPQYRSEQWLVGQPKSGFTIQLGVFASERAATDFIVSNGNSADFRYFEIPVMPDPALGFVAVTRPRFTVTYGEFFSSGQAVAVAGSLKDFGQQSLVRPWESYQITLASVKSVMARAQAASEMLIAPEEQATQAFQGVDPVEALQNKQSKPQ